MTNFFRNKNDNRQKGLKMRKIASLILLSVFVIFAAAGCQQPAKRTATGELAANEQPVNIYYLAGRLGMEVSQSDDNKIVFNDADNTVTIYPKNDQVYVNNNYLSPLGRTKKINDMLHVRSNLEQQIRSALISGIKPPIPQITRPVEKVLLPRRPVVTGRTIVIDAGHGGKDPGATSSSGYEEKTVNLDVALQIAQTLRDKGYKVIMTRNNDEFIELEERANIANRNKADIFVSIHSDSSTKSSTNGFTVYVERSSSSASVHLANAIDRRMSQTGLSGNGMSKADYRVLTHTRCPAVLIELGYLSNYWEAKQLKNKDMQRQLAQAITEGITDYITR
jgi:N-acetylmuramoyl-L-alanine amidase